MNNQIKRQQLQAIVTQRLAEVAARDAVQVGRQFYHKNDPDSLSTVISITQQPPYLDQPIVYVVNWRKDRDGNTYGLYRALDYFRELTAINGCWRIVPQS